MIKSKRSRAKLAGLSILVFTVLLMLSEITVAILTSTNALPESIRAYAISLIALPVGSLLSTLLVVFSFYDTAKKTEILVAGLDKVARGDYSVSIESKKHDSFSQVYDNFNKMTRELDSVKTLREDFVHELSHEIKTPLCSISGFASLLSEGGATEEERKKYLGIIVEEADRLRRFADGLLTLSKLEHQQLVGESRELRVDLQIRECVIALEREWEKKELEINLDLKPVIIKTDAELLRHIWNNLLTNAIKFTPCGGKLTVSLRRENGSLVAVFRDNGAGIGEEDLPRIFDKFYRSASSENKEGYGVGLAICKRICTLLEGEISCKSKKGEGAEFTVKLPL